MSKRGSKQASGQAGESAEGHRFSLSIGGQAVWCSELVRDAERDVVQIITRDRECGVMAEYEWILWRYPEAQIEMQSLAFLPRLGATALDRNASEGSAYYDVMELCLPGQQKKKVFFDISLFYPLRAVPVE